ncbi:MAG: 1-acyl-sn-glycerol-3-phosphate acyltransferase [Treponema sp.]|jgi:glycerol-3-phosphate O-acyltransferase|nr:1-acyl-sn-glycerol-3-phosphate acyltransferase [Treponema sp.]
MVDTLSTAFGVQIKKAMSMTKAAVVITEDNVYQEGDRNILPLLDEMVESLLLPGSALAGLENLEDLYQKAESGKSCLLMVEHYSNMDLSLVSLMARKAGGRGKEIGDSIIAIAGMKLNEDNPIVAAFASAYTRIVIYPSRYLHGIDEEIKKVELPRSNSINRAAMRTLNEKKLEGKLVLVFPAGTRYRAWDPETKKGVREIDSYIRSFDYMCFIALNGEVLHVQKTDMLNDAVSKDVVLVTASPVVSCEEFREKARASAKDDEDKKQVVVDAIMNELEKLHIAAEEERKKIINSK